MNLFLGGNIAGILQVLISWLDIHWICWSWSISQFFKMLCLSTFLPFNIWYFIPFLVLNWPLRFAKLSRQLLNAVIQCFHVPMLCCILQLCCQWLYVAPPVSPYSSFDCSVCFRLFYLSLYFSNPCATVVSCCLLFLPLPLSIPRSLLSSIPFDSDFSFLILPGMLMLLPFLYSSTSLQLSLSLSALL